ncbi:4-methyl-5(b-hydroxyethyl)-thiazole monophosphate biosynthesis [Dysgonomonas sp. PFB1-18]|uniref:DJ-1 family glyoxalase III n=1 Tax=unclassified Dysgonomonas TaxID=2630389 RepID=UPI002474FB75|nr:MULTISPECIES: DJ-1 family glyoxalase III [unclassified Dysgonomonas]MDH6311037.1 4-methyl-5(b-hydroxyethyl)-thiazole monophosphate biosynthesis [Dysgonomonas sp. PF1-14]MDH6337886.1 4-methyl-5(b-hydroxyethyl)-thiazole monophosphate biosynthesis [Dysgonomonas sp. PF1-16]MDH6382585.1 4-methyl-5(b-hydroxyethyl)-thiazole monophosphate biosynthesis [Dysgonomonas sp. PFB1-18]MDH6398018.1 4-methyl-5(b-hydroxyethyl)-thiazole monophosphate biosynthesis [Dysgonomonas sp. PF1-23]
MKTIFIFLTTGFEEIEALATIDILRRAELDVKSVSLTDSKQVMGSHQINVAADLMFDQVDFSQAEMLVLPGGTTKFNEHENMKKELLAFANKGKKVAAICASPMVLGGLGLLEGKNATCYPGFEKYLDGANLQTDKAVVVDGNITTGRGPGLTIDFALNLVEQLGGKEKRDAVAAGLLVK